MHKTPKTLTESEQQLLMNWLWQRKYGTVRDAVPCRNYTMAILMLYAGLRVGELVRLKVNDVWYDTEPKNSLVVRAETSKCKIDRTIPLCMKILDALWELKHYWFADPKETPDRYIFRHSISTQHITTRRVQQIIGDASDHSIGRRIHPHVLRHTFGSKLMRITNSRVVQQLLGHSSLSSTQIYTHPNQDDLTEAINGL